MYRSAVIQSCPGLDDNDGMDSDSTMLLVMPMVRVMFKLLVLILLCPKVVVTRWLASYNTTTFDVWRCPTITRNRSLEEASLKIFLMNAVGSNNLTNLDFLTGAPLPSITRRKETNWPTIGNAYNYILGSIMAGRLWPLFWLRRLLVAGFTPLVKLRLYFEFWRLPSSFMKTDVNKSHRQIYWLLWLVTLARVSSQLH